MISREVFNQMAKEALEKIDKMKEEYSNDIYLTESYMNGLSAKIKKIYEIVCEE